jgi:chaperonin cofactor prefoldin
MSKDNSITQLEEKLRNIEDRLIALEKEQRLIREDILSGTPTERMRQR